MMWDDHSFYVAAHMQEPDIWATYTEHDSIVFHENDFEVFVDPDGDNHRYYEWEVNALGTTFDLFMERPYRAGCRNDNSWDPAVEVRIGIDGVLNDPDVPGRSWTVEAAFPWAAFDRDRDGKGSPPAIGDQWRINFSRVEWDLEAVGGVYSKIPERPEHNWVWSPQWMVDMHVPWLWGYVQFEENASVPLRSDPHHAAKMALAEVYWSQIKAKEATGAFAESIPGMPGITLQVREQGFVASLASNGLVLCMDHECRIWIRR